MARFLSEKDIASTASEIRARFQIASGGANDFSIPVERLALDLFGADVDWESLGEICGHKTVLGKLNAPCLGRNAEIRVNLDVIDSLFKDSKWLFNTVIAHELGHLVLHISSGQHLQLGFDFVQPVTFDIRSSHLEKALGSTLNYTDRDWQEWQAHTFARHLLIPRTDLEKRIGRSHHIDWPTIYRLSDEYEVTPSMMRVQLIKVGAIVPETHNIVAATNRRLEF